MLANVITGILERTVTCNLCGGRDHEQLNRNNEYGFSFVRCGGCGLMFYEPRFLQSDVATAFLPTPERRRHAEQLLDQFVGGEEQPHSELANFYHRLLDDHISCYQRLNGRQPDSLFQPDAAGGFYLRIARDRLRETTRFPLLQGCEADPHAASLARSRLGADVRDGAFNLYQTIPDQIGRFALVAMLDSLARSYTPVSDLAKLADLAAPGSVLFLRTFLDELDPAGMYAHPVLHPHHFTEKTLLRTIETTGWKIHVFDKQREWSLGLVSVLAERSR